MSADAGRLCRRIGLDETGLQQRLHYLGIGGADLQNLATIHAAIGPEIEAIVAEFYAHLNEFAALSPLLGDDRMRTQLSATFRRYLQTLGQDPASLERAEERLRVGEVHERIGLGFHWFLGAHSKLSSAIVARLARHLPADVVALTDSLNKLLAFDAALAVEIYHRAATERLEEIVRQQRVAQQQLQAAARLDDLTGALTRGAALDSLGVELRRSQGSGQPLAIVVADVDHFKAINDTRGHAFGDEVLVQVVQSIRKVVRPWDIVGRLGGDELVIGLVACRDSGARRIAGRIRRKVMHALPDATVTLSMGLVVVTDAGSDLPKVLAIADAALYRAKADGRNCIRVASSADFERAAEGS